MAAKFEQKVLPPFTYFFKWNPSVSRCKTYSIYILCSVLNYNWKRYWWHDGTRSQSFKESSYKQYTYLHSCKIGPAANGRIIKTFCVNLDDDEELQQPQIDICDKSYPTIFVAHAINFTYGKREVRYFVMVYKRKKK